MYKSEIHQMVKTVWKRDNSSDLLDIWFLYNSSQHRILNHSVYFCAFHFSSTETGETNLLLALSELAYSITTEITLSLLKLTCTNNQIENLSISFKDIFKIINTRFTTMTS